MASNKKKAVCRRIGSLVILVQGTETPSDPEWNEVLSLMGRRDELNASQVLVVSSGGGPSMAQRQKLEDLLRDTKVCSAVVSDSVKVRFIVATVALFSDKISTFTLAEIKKAYDYLKLTREQIVLAEKALPEMRRELA